MDTYQQERQERAARRILNDLIGDGALDHLRFSDQWPEMRAALREYEIGEQA